MFVGGRDICGTFVTDFDREMLGFPWWKKKPGQAFLPKNRVLKKNTQIQLECIFDMYR